MIRLSLVIPFLNSHEIVRRQIIHYKRMDLPDEVETLFMDDGSDPPLQLPDDPPRNFHIIPTNEFRPWTSSMARNTAARRYAKGKYLLMTDGDYIVRRADVERALRFDGDRLGFRREFGVLDENGEFKQDWDTLVAWGLPRKRLEEKGIHIPTHPNNFVMKATLFAEMGGYDEERILTRTYPQKEDNAFKAKLMAFIAAGKATKCEEDRTRLAMFPNGQYCGDVDANPFELFHTLTRKSAHNYWYTHDRYSCYREE